jgi:hypothetical protein
MMMMTMMLWRKMGRGENENLTHFITAATAAIALHD